MRPFRRPVGGVVVGGHLVVGKFVCGDYAGEADMTGFHMCRISGMDKGFEGIAIAFLTAVLSYAIETAQ